VEVLDFPGVGDLGDGGGGGAVDVGVVAVIQEKGSPRLPSDLGRALAFLSGSDEAVLGPEGVEPGALPHEPEATGVGGSKVEPELEDELGVNVVIEEFLPVDTYGIGLKTPGT